MARVNIRVSFEVTDTWSRGDFREFIKLVRNTEDIDLYIVTDSEDTAYIDSVATALNIDDSRVFVDSKVDAVDEEAIDIHLDSDYEDVLAIIEETDAEAILVKADPNEVGRPSYVDQFNQALTDIVDA